MNNQSISTDVLIQQARDGDARSADLLLGRYREFIRLLVRRQADGRLQARVDNSDLIQETLLRVAQNFGQFQGSTEDEWCAWLARIAENEIIHQRRHHLGAEKRTMLREQRGNGATHEVENGVSLLEHWFTRTQTSPSLAAVRNERSVLLANALALLPDDYREVLVLRHLDGLDFPEVAQRMKRSSGAVRVLWTRSLRKLREILQQNSSVD